MNIYYQLRAVRELSEGGLITNNQSNDSQVTNSTQDIRTSSVNKKQSFIVN